LAALGFAVRVLAAARLPAGDFAVLGFAFGFPLAAAGLAAARLAVGLAAAGFVLGAFAAAVFDFAWVLALVLATLALLSTSNDLEIDES